MNPVTLLLLSFVAIAVVGTALAAAHDLVAAWLRRRSRERTVPPAQALPLPLPRVRAPRTPPRSAPLMVRERGHVTLRA